MAFECSIEGRLGLVSDLGGDIADAAVAGFQHPGRQEQSPARQVGDWRLIKKMPESLRKNGS